MRIFTTPLRLGALFTVAFVGGCDLQSGATDSFRFDEEAKTQQEKDLANGAKWKALDFPKGWTISDVRLVRFSVLAPDGVRDEPIQVFRADGQLLLTGRSSELANEGVAVLVPNKDATVVVKRGAPGTQVEAEVQIDNLNQAIHRI